MLYVDDGDLVVHVNGGDTEVLLEGVGNTTEPIGFSGDAALYNIQLGNGENDGRWIEAGGPEHDPQPVGTYIYTDSTGDGWSAALTKVTDDGTCSQTTAPHGNAVGETCDFTLDSFSPDGANVLAGPHTAMATATESWPWFLVTTSTEIRPRLVHYVQSLETDATFMASRWEDDEHVLAVTSTPIRGHQRQDVRHRAHRPGRFGRERRRTRPGGDVEIPFGFATADPLTTRVPTNAWVGASYGHGDPASPEPAVRLGGRDDIRVRWSPARHRRPGAGQAVRHQPFVLPTR